MKGKNPISRKEDIIVQEYDGEVLIYDLKANKAFCLNETSAIVWQACDGTRDVPALGEYVGKQLKSKVSDDVVWLAIDQLKKESLLESAPEADGRFAGMSRREVIRKVGIGALVAVPIVTGLVAPPAYAQTSVCGTTCNCDNAVVYAAGAICGTTGGGAGVSCPAAPAGCFLCRATGGGRNSAGTCFTA